MKFFLFAAVATLFTITTRAGDLASDVLGVNLARSRALRGVCGESTVAARGSRAARRRYAFSKRPALAPLEWSGNQPRRSPTHDNGSAAAAGTPARAANRVAAMARFGQRTGSAAENISYGLRIARDRRR
jgi:hypothetical protein